MTRWVSLLVTIAGTSLPAFADEIDVRGSWQANLECGGYATATTFYSFDQNLPTGVVTELPAPCGTVTLAGEAVAPASACTVTPAPSGGLVSGTSFSLPATGYDSVDQTLATPVYWDLFGCLVSRTIVESRHTGAVSDGGTGVATSITGSITYNVVDVLRPDGSVCLHFGPFTPCTYVMLRNDVPAGTNVTVKPNANVQVTFATVTGAGAALVTPLNDPDGEIPANFHVLGGVLPIFYDVSTTATIAGPITTCYFYGDANQDGIIDGTTIAEIDLRMLHEEDLSFVDRTVSLDPIGNVICAETTSLSQLAPGAFATPPGGGSSDDVVVAGIKLIVKRNPSGVEKGSFVSRDRARITTPTLGGPNDPRTVGATFEVVSDAEGVDAYSLPAGGWTATTAGTLKFIGALVGSDVKKAVIKPDKAITVKLLATDLPLAEPHGAMAVRLTTGGLRHCARFGSTNIVRDEPNRFVAKGAKAAALLDCSDAALGIGSPSGAFVDS
jgi:hypothetical protein